VEWLKVMVLSSNTSSIKQQQKKVHRNAIPGADQAQSTDYATPSTWGTQNYDSPFGGQ
jgi:hypothetical protein